MRTEEEAAVEARFEICGRQAMAMDHDLPRLLPLYDIKDAFQAADSILRVHRERERLAPRRRMTSVR
jgi:hypothetical protein